VRHPDQAAHGRGGEPPTPANMQLAQLISDEAGWVSGQTIRANGAMF
jgi:NAD(P)-dependent dehydrogenase (short-subunit alcohol dehydrogenase family)